MAAPTPSPAPADRDADLRYLRRALELAERGRLAVSPNPMVGAVVVRDGRVVGEGWHRRLGGPHAEVEAFRAAGQATRGATLYVSLEPCDHQGRTPPCSVATIEAGIRRVVACHRDPDPRVSGTGFERLRRAGVEVEHGLLVPEAVRLNWRFVLAAVHGRPAVTLKWAMSLDGRIATREGDSQWISSPEGRRWALELRECHDGILIGSGTALADDPRLDRRLSEAPGPITRVILDRRLRLSPAARLFTVDGPILVYARPASDPGAFEARRRALEGAGATVVVLEDPAPRRVLEDLHSRGLRSILVEGGAGIAGAFLDAGLYDRVAVCCAPLLVGGDGSPGPVGGKGFAPLAAAPRLGPL
ncbi:MAG: bifunctional diaminohydroxyphosphoribosylaminopyrimidine deaminase/5-amino-6-(5-phosphoribosylamino)uracil reductase RibD, partial [Holophagales bacterium]|nr:bifunctional diaminohydroxyphosphoribosylaminopyrimidine deaminase/5-amino-6-(5-phosphoribosylamino)uracil reductase RibD [Holophagales bacterium]